MLTVEQRSQVSDCLRNTHGGDSDVINSFEVRKHLALHVQKSTASLIV